MQLSSNTSYHQPKRLPQAVVDLEGLLSQPDHGKIISKKGWLRVDSSQQPAKGILGDLQEITKDISITQKKHQTIKKEVAKWRLSSKKNMAKNA